MYFMVTTLRDEQPLVTVVETAHLPIYAIEFPSVALCPYNHINWIRYEAAKEKFLPHNPSNETQKAFYDLLVAMENMTFTYLSSVGKLLKRQPLPQVVNDISLNHLAQFMAFRCNEIFVWCSFDGTEYDCCKLFVRERTDQGVCLVFNSLISVESRIKKLKDSYYPWRVRKSGAESGLSFILRYNASYVRPNTYTSFRFKLMVKEAQEWSQILYHIFYPNTHADVMITPILTETASEARLIDPEKRNCLFWNEKSSKYGRIDGLPYNKLNCLSHCQHKFIMKHCEYNNKECKVADLACLYRHRDVFNYLKGPLQDHFINDTRRGMNCDCIDNCLSMVYLVAVNTQPIHSFQANTKIPEIYAHVYYNRDTLTKYASRLDYTFLDMVAYFGGVLGLFLGASVFSFVEILYAVIRWSVCFIFTKLKVSLLSQKVRVRTKVDVIRE
ncbi:pickpocket protein 19-like [Musca autumnalis]|uniref:pickpocket protein 19-like n=1 Tax=Musca autumnalis TaxID=221902 RepID=UPI003CF1DC36